MQTPVQTETEHPSFVPDSRLPLMPLDWLKNHPAPPGALYHIIYPDGNPYNERWHHRTPFICGPKTVGNGGVIYFENPTGQPSAGSHFHSFMKMMKVGQLCTESSQRYAAFVHESEHPIVEGYFVQLRLVSESVLKKYWKLDDDRIDEIPRSTLDMATALWTFVESGCERWGTEVFEIYDETLVTEHQVQRGRMSFGFMIEGLADGDEMYRIWSRMTRVSDTEE